MEGGRERGREGGREGEKQIRGGNFQFTIASINQQKPVKVKGQRQALIYCCSPSVVESVAEAWL